MYLDVYERDTSRYTARYIKIQWDTYRIGKFVFCLTGPYLTGRATIGRLELPPGEGRFVEPY